MVSSRVIYSLLFYTLAILLIIVAKPTIMFSREGEIRRFGVGRVDDGNPQTVFSFGVFVVVLAIISFYIFALIDVIFGKK